MSSPSGFGFAHAEAPADAEADPTARDTLPEWRAGPADRDTLPEWRDAGAGDAETEAEAKAEAESPESPMAEEEPDRDTLPEWRKGTESHADLPVPNAPPQSYKPDEYVPPADSGGAASSQTLHQGRSRLFKGITVLGKRRSITLPMAARRADESDKDLSTKMISRFRFEKTSEKQMPIKKPDELDHDLSSQTIFHFK